MKEAGRFYAASKYEGKVDREMFRVLSLQHFLIITFTPTFVLTRVSK